MIRKPIRGNLDASRPYALNARVAELEDRVSCIIQYGLIKEIRYKKEEDSKDEVRETNVRVAVGGVVTQWIPWMQAWSGANAVTFDPIAEGDPVLVLSPGGEMTLAVALSGLYIKEIKVSETDQYIHRKEFSDGTVVTHDREHSHTMYSIPKEGKFTVKVGQSSLVIEDGKTTLTTPKFEGVRP